MYPNVLGATASEVKHNSLSIDYQAQYKTTKPLGKLHPTLYKENQNSNGRVLIQSIKKRKKQPELGSPRGRGKI
jgi:hypothetical protein